MLADFPERMDVELNDCLILLQEKKFSSMKDLLPLLEQIAIKPRPHLYGQRLLRPSKIRVYRALAPGQRDDLGSS